LKRRPFAKRESIEQMNEKNRHLTTRVDNPDCGRCVLIVDDDALNLKLFATTLARRGYRVLLAMDGRRGL
jgi:hypothetical protein